jgi:hypothetical protein
LFFFLFFFFFFFFSSFQKYEKVLVWVWEDEPEEITTSNLLVTINDSLLAHPVFIQAFSRHDEPEIVDVPFPLSKEQQLPNVPETDERGPDKTQYTKENMHLHPSVQKLHRLLHLDLSCGVIRVARMMKEEEVGKDEMEWVVQCVHYGIPLYDQELNTMVCKKLESHHLFDSKNLRRFAMETRLLSLRLLDFIAMVNKDNNGDHLEAEFEFRSVPYPMREITFSNHQLL